MQGIKLWKTRDGKAVLNHDIRKLSPGLCNWWRAHLCISVHHLILLNHLPADLAAVVHDGIHLCPRPELPLPVSDGGERGNDEERAVDSPEEYFWKECDGLDGFP